MAENETLSDPSTGTEDEQRRPFWVVGLALLGFVIVVLASAFLLDRQLRPRVGIEPAPATSAIAAPTLTANRSPTAGATPAAQPTSVIPVATAFSGVRTSDSVQAREIEEAYLRYWNILVQGYLTLDSTQFAEVMAGAELARQQQEVRDLRLRGRAAKLEVTHRAAMSEIASDRAVVYDEYLNRSVFVDPTTKQELPASEPPETERISFELRKIDSKWKVTDAARRN